MLYDISQTLGNGLPVWPGDTEYNAVTTWTINDHCPVNVSKITCSSHSGTHADAPLHYDPSGKSIAEVELQPYLGLCQVIDLSQSLIHNHQINLLDCQALIRTDPHLIQRILFKTYTQFPHGQWHADFISLHAEIIDWLGQQGCRLIGIDSPSIDPQESKHLAAHYCVRQHNMAILEGLVLDQVGAGIYELIALPLKLDKLDAAPVRAVLRTLNDGGYRHD